MKKLNLESTFEYGSWKGKTVEDIINTKWYSFNALFEKNKFMYDEDVIEYYYDIKKSLHHKNSKEMQTFIDLKNT